jgi:hypothetical protein
MRGLNHPFRDGFLFLLYKSLHIMKIRQVYQEDLLKQKKLTDACSDWNATVGCSFPSGMEHYLL